MEKIQLQSSGNLIAVTHFRPTGTSDISVIMNCATGAKQTYFWKFAQYIANKGIRVFTYDYSGIGQSAPKSLKGYQTSASQWGESDLTAVINYVSHHFAYKKLILINQSIGGQIACLSPSIHKVDGMVHVASQTGYWKQWPLRYRYLLYFNWQMLVGFSHIFGYFPGKSMGIMENLPKGVALEWAKWGKSPNYLFDHISPEEKARYETIKTPLLSYSFSDDTTAPYNTVQWLNTRFKNCTLIDKHIHPEEIGLKKIGHFGFFRTKCQPLWEDLLAEIRKW